MHDEACARAQHRPRKKTEMSGQKNGRMVERSGHTRGEGGLEGKKESANGTKHTFFSFGAAAFTLIYLRPLFS
jgi:hypothetical protein